MVDTISQYIRRQVFRFSIQLNSIQFNPLRIYLLLSLSTSSSSTLSSNDNWRKETDVDVDFGVDFDRNNDVNVNHHWQMFFYILEYIMCCRVLDTVLFSVLFFSYGTKGRCCLFNRILVIPGTKKETRAKSVEKHRPKCWWNIVLLLWYKTYHHLSWLILYVKLI